MFSTLSCFFCKLTSTKGLNEVIGVNHGVEMKCFAFCIADFKILNEQISHKTSVEIVFWWLTRTAGTLDKPRTDKSVPFQATSPILMSPALMSFASILSSRLSSPRSWEESVSGSATAGAHCCPKTSSGSSQLLWNLKRHRSPTKRQHFIWDKWQTIYSAFFSHGNIYVKIHITWCLFWDWPTGMKKIKGIKEYCTFRFKNKPSNICFLNVMINFIQA